MTQRLPLRRWWLAAALAAAGCISPNSDVLDGTEGCDPGEDIDPTVRRFLEASKAFGEAAAGLEGDVLDACARIATDLGAQDTWSELGDSQDAVSNPSGTGACDTAGRLVESALLEAGQANAEIALVVTRGQCRYDFEAQAACEAACAPACDSGSVETRCEPGELSVMCQTECSAGSTCEGSTELPANCMGQCEATCQGQCAGTCVNDDGSVTQNDPNCRGKCSSSCNGTCRGLCKVEAPEGVACGVSVRCTGECTGTYSDPVCTTEFTPPNCTTDQACFAACAAETAANAECDPPRIDVFVDLTVAPELAPVVATLEDNLPALFHAAEQKGRALLEAAGELRETGQTVSDQLEDLDGDSLACVAESATSLAEAAGRLDVSVRASAEISVTVESNTL
jgi:hypothetical protein